MSIGEWVIGLPLGLALLAAFLYMVGGFTAMIIQVLTGYPALDKYYGDKGESEKLYLDNGEYKTRSQIIVDNADGWSP